MELRFGYITLTDTDTGDTDTRDVITGDAAEIIALLREAAESGEGDTPT